MPNYGRRLYQLTVVPKHRQFPTRLWIKAHTSTPFPPLPPPLLPHQIMPRHTNLLIAALCLLAPLLTVIEAYKLPQSGTATVTHYLLGDAVGACDCETGANKYPVAAINQNAFGPGSGAGPGCGRCFHLTIYAAISKPTYTIPSSIRLPEVTLKIVDLCPAKAPNLEWCAQTDTKPNPHGSWVHFDISQTTIPTDFFPQPYGYDMGTWFANYTEVSCTAWDGWKKDNTSGLAYPGAGCCPANPVKDGNICKFPNGSNLTDVGDVNVAAQLKAGWGMGAMIGWMVTLAMGKWVMRRV
ncbi:RlpA-like double-psi beta-barrel-protein domain-containing protein-containing protein [Jimgerdemannia flammicorona]|uniref:RlpA-like double-psi beta-barrel-protein domain-containing protein-containing protein n=2 Tax=Jimgerdemannia flammicorona TaxID=994334 RepID=A0A433Q7K9_9FUNG|nr:RlpA-like double-psi beta-barrel-protein domain-containing protein-containing protein [Jimgerdemannia flammicorona]RUS25752.1 RlpA-like double-psi beta-barrel-protein domain-containing protein-containing protein [Jimgerdemannia flammicorona]